MSYPGNTDAKAVVKVRLDHDFDGSIYPLMFRTEDGPAIQIDRVLDVRPGASLKAGGTGMRYTCRVRGKQLYLFYDDGARHWFVERDQLRGGLVEDEWADV